MMRPLYLTLLLTALAILQGWQDACAQAPDARHAANEAVFLNTHSTSETLRGTQYFRRSVSDIDNITPEMRLLARSLDSLYRENRIDSLLIFGHSSPEGPRSLNEQLALRRARNVERYLKFATSLPDSIFHIDSRPGSWEELEIILRSRDWTDPVRARKAADIIASVSSDNTPLFSNNSDYSNNSNNRISSSLRKADYGWVWRWLDSEAFPLMRTASTTAVILTPALDEVEVTDCTGGRDESRPYFSDNSDYSDYSDSSEYSDNSNNSDYSNPLNPEPRTQNPEPTPRYLYLKSNLPAWLLSWLNAAVEVDLCPHLSFTLPVYYSGFNYFKKTLKFRTFALQPELRIWPSRRNHGFFVGAHFGMAYYNVALDGDTRWQDHDGNTPTLGGGISVGYRFRLNSNPNLSMEATVGAGIYPLDYDTFVNKPNGLLTGRHKRTFYGVDNAALSITYRFGLRKKSPKAIPAATADTSAGEHKQKGGIR